MICDAEIDFFSWKVVGRAAAPQTQEFRFLSLFLLPGRLVVGQFETKRTKS